MTEEELKINLYALKEMLDKIELNPVENILYFNIESYYLYLEYYYKNKVYISNIMKMLEPYIPLSLCVDSEACSILADAVSTDNPKIINNLRLLFYKRAVLKFFAELKTLNTQEEFDHIFNLCNNLRIMQSV